MLNLTPLAVMAAVATLLPPALATFDASANTNMAVYWGQGPNQKPLEFFCDDDNIDIIQIGFVNVFPDQSGGYPGTNFGNQCGSQTYQNINGSSSLLLSHCPGIGPNITYCQSIGKKVLLSLGGAIPTNQHLDSDVSAVEFATFLWEAFGPEDTSKTTPRPFGNAIVDGFDFDIENVLASGENKGDLDRGYGTMVNTLRTLYNTDKSKSYYVSAAPQCVVPDKHLADAIETSPFDFLFIQFYNTPSCSARAYFDHSYGGTHTNISFASWVEFVQDQSFNPNTKVYLGLPAAPDTNIVYEPEMYLQPNEASEIIKALQCEYKHEFGGVMIYEATFSQNNQIHGQSYADVLKGYLENTECTVSPVTSSATVHSTLASSTLAVTTTPAVSTTHTASSVSIASSSTVTPSASSVRVSSSSSTTAAINSIPTSSGKTSASISTSGSSIPTSSVTEVSTASTATSVSLSVYTPVNGSSSVFATAVTSSVPASTQKAGNTTSISLFTSASGSSPPPTGASVSRPSSYGTSGGGSVPPPSASSISGPYQNTTSTTRSSVAASFITSSTPSLIVSGTTVSLVPESTEYTSLTTYTTVTSCPVTTTKVQSGVTSIIVETSLITSTITTCPRCSEKTKSASVPGVASSTPGSSGEVSTTVPISVPAISASPSASSVAQSSPNVAPAGQSSGPLPTLTTYTTTEIVTKLTTICPEATTFSLSPSGRVYSATAHETLTISECPCTLTYTTTGYAVPTEAGSPSGPLKSGVPLGAVGNANSFPTATSYLAGASGSSGSGNAPSKSEAGNSNSLPQGGSSSPSIGSESSTEGSNGSSSAGSPAVSNEGSQSQANSESGAAVPSAGSPAASNNGSQSKPNAETGAAVPSAGAPAASSNGSQNKSNGENGAAVPSAGAPSVSNAGIPSETNSESNSESGASSPGAENKAAAPAPQQASPKQSTAQSSPSEAGPAGSVPKAGSQSLASGVTGAHLPVVTMEIIPIPQSPSQVAQSGKANQNGQPSGQSSGASSGQSNGVESGHQSGQSGKETGQQNGQQNAQQNAQQNTQQNAQQNAQQSGQQSNSALLSTKNGTAPVSPSGTISARPSSTAPASQGAGNGGPSPSSPLEFKGAADKVGGSFLGVVAAAAAAILLL